MENKPLTEDEAAAYLGISLGTLKALRRKGDGPAHYQLAYRKIVYEIEDLDKWRASRRRG